MSTDERPAARPGWTAEEVHDSYWQRDPITNAYIEIKHRPAPATVLQPVNPHCPNCRSVMYWVSCNHDDLTGVARCGYCKVSVTARRYLEVPPVNS